MENKIPIKNIYYMLSYAWDTLKQDKKVLAGSEDFENIYNLLAYVYINGVNSLIKRGLNKYYINETAETFAIKGKINISSSIKKQTQKNLKMVCEFDEFVENFILNRVVKTTIELFLKSPQLKYEYKQRLSKLKIYFRSIDCVNLSKSLFANLRFNKNDYHYRLLINISELIYNGLISNEDGDRIEFSDFIRDHQMSNLFEKFVLKFYSSKLPKNRFLVHAPKIEWDVDNDCDTSLLPEMRTDIVVEDKSSNHQLIVDTKYYSKTLINRNYSEIEKIRSAHLFQIYAYINNSKFEGDVDGMLLYPTIEKELDLTYSIGNKNISVKTLNLNTPWDEIEKRLSSMFI